MRTRNILIALSLLAGSQDVAMAQVQELMSFGEGRQEAICPAGQEG